jgi:hypothetical protein
MANAIIFYFTLPFTKAVQEWHEDFPAHPSTDPYWEHIKETITLPQHYFGEPWPSGVCDGGVQVHIPLGKLCFECSEPIEEGQNGSFLYANPMIAECMDPLRVVYVTVDGMEYAMNPMHKECAFRAVMGGIGHFEDHQRWCNVKHDPDGGRTRRQSSLEVWARFTG